MPNNRRLLGLTGSDGQVLTAHPQRDLLGSWDAGGGGGGGAMTWQWNYSAPATPPPGPGQVFCDADPAQPTLYLSKLDAAGVDQSLVFLNIAPPYDQLIIQSQDGSNSQAIFQLQTFANDDGTYLTFNTLAVGFQNPNPFIGTFPATINVMRGFPAPPSSGDIVVGPDAFNTPSTPGYSTHYSREDHDHGLPAIASIPNPASVVTGPPAFSASPLVGVGLDYARQDHAHGLPANPVPTLSTTWAHAWNTAGQAFLTGGNTWIIQTYTNADTGSSSALNTSTGAYTAPAAGDYLVFGQTNFPTNASSGSLFISIFKNGVIYARGTGVTTAPVNTQTPALEVSAVVRCAAGDTMGIRIWCSIASGISSSADASGATNYMIVRQLL